MAATPMMEEGESVSLRDALLVVVRRRRIILGVWAIFFVLALAGIVLLPPRYRAAAKILITSNRAEISTNAEKPTELVRTSQVNQSELNSQIEIVRNRELVEQVMRAMGALDTIEAPPIGIGRIVRAIVKAPANLVEAAYQRIHKLETPAVEEQMNERVESVREDTEVNALKNTNVLEIGFTGRDGLWAADYVNRLVAAYVEEHARLQREFEAEQFFITQSELLRQKLASSEAGLRAEREKAGTLSGQQTEVHERLNEFSAELSRTQIARAEQDQRVAFLERLRGGPGEIATPELLALEAKRADLLGRYLPDSERVRDIDDQIARLRTAIKRYDTVSPGADAAGTDLTAARASLAALKGKETALAQQQQEYRRQAELLDAQSFDLARLERQVKLDEEAYLSYVRTAEESRLSNALQQSKMLRLTVLEPATPSTVPVSPDPGRLLGLAVFGGLAVSLACGFIRDRLDTTVKSSADVRRSGDLDVLAVLPERT